MYCVSVPVVFLCLVGGFFMMLASFWAEDYLKQSHASDEYIILVPSIIYSILVFVVNAYYRRLATFLTEWGRYSHSTSNNFLTKPCREPPNTIPIRQTPRNQTSPLRIRQQLHVFVLHRFHHQRHGNVAKSTTDNADHLPVDQSHARSAFTIHH